MGMAPLHRTPGEDVTPLEATSSSASTSHTSVQPTEDPSDVRDVRRRLEERVVLILRQLLQRGPHALSELPNFTLEEREIFLEEYQGVIERSIMSGRGRDLVRLVRYLLYRRAPLPGNPLVYACSHGKRAMLKVLIREMSNWEGSLRPLLETICCLKNEERAANTLKSLDRFNPDYQLSCMGGTPPVLHALRRSHWRLAAMMFERMHLPHFMPFHEETELSLRERVRDRIIHTHMAIPKELGRGEYAIDHGENEMVYHVLRSGHEGLILSAFTIGGLDPELLYDGKNLVHRLCEMQPFDRIDVLFERILHVVAEAGEWRPPHVPISRSLDAYGNSPMKLLVERMKVNPFRGEEMIGLLLIHGAQSPDIDHYGVGSDGESRSELSDLRCMTSRRSLYVIDPRASFRTLMLCDPPNERREFMESCSMDINEEESEMYGPEGPGEPDADTVTGVRILWNSLPHAILSFVCYWYDAVGGEEGEAMDEDEDDDDDWNGSDVGEEEEEDEAEAPEEEEGEVEAAAPAPAPAPAAATAQVPEAPDTSQGLYEMDFDEICNITEKEFRETK